MNSHSKITEHTKTSQIEKYVKDQGFLSPFELREKFEWVKEGFDEDFHALDVPIHSKDIYLVFWGFSREFVDFFQDEGIGRLNFIEMVVLFSYDSAINLSKFEGGCSQLSEDYRRRIEESLDSYNQKIKMAEGNTIHYFPSEAFKTAYQDDKTHYRHKPSAVVTNRGDV